MSASPQSWRDADRLAEAVVAKVGKRIVLALPLGIGKANTIANALYARAAADPAIRLTIFTALTLEKPGYANPLERRFLAPVIERLFGGYPDLAYATALHAGTLPPNIEVNEFFFLAGRWLRVPRAQQHYISANYSHAFRYVLDRGVNVIAQLVARSGPADAARYSLGSNPDLTLDLLRARAEGTADFMLLGETNAGMPFMPGEAELPAQTFDHMLEGPDFPLFAPPSEPIGLAEYATGLHIARLVPDGGTLQLGIGQVGDGVAQSLILRHRHNAAFREAVAALAGAAPVAAPACHDAPFDRGLYGVSEMFFEAFLPLIEAGVLRREVDGAILHAAFFLGPNSFYAALRDMDETARARLRMVPVSFTNTLYGDAAAKRKARIGARFINNAMMATLLGAVVSDGLEDGRVVSGVGGQHDFVNQAFALPDARSVIAIKAFRETRGRAQSNVLWRYGHETIPRHLRDIVVSEYGIADLRGKADHEVVAAMLSIADSRFQPDLLRQARDAGKIAASYEIPAACRDNVPDRIARILTPFRDRGLLPEFPFGTDFSETEQALIPALERLKAASTAQLLGYGWRGAFAAGAGETQAGKAEAAAIARMGYDRPAGLTDRVYAALLRGALRS